MLRPQHVNAPELPAGVQVTIRTVQTVGGRYVPVRNFLRSQVSLWRARAYLVAREPGNSVDVYTQDTCRPAMAVVRAITTV